MAKFVLLNSGGLDSALLAAYLDTKLGHEVHSLHIDLHQLNRNEVQAAALITANKWCASHKIIEVNLGQTSNYWQTIDGPAAQAGPQPVEMYDSLTTTQNNNYKTSRSPRDFHDAPAIGMICMSIGQAYAKTIGATAVYTGHRGDRSQGFENNYNDFMDNTPYRVPRIPIRIPLWQDPSYREVAIKLVGLPLTQTKLNALRAEFAHTHSCIWPAPCGVCYKCTERTNIGLT